MPGKPWTWSTSRYTRTAVAPRKIVTVAQALAGTSDPAVGDSWLSRS